MKSVLTLNRLQNHGRIFLLDKRFGTVEEPLLRIKKRVFGVGPFIFTYLMRKVGIGKHANLLRIGLKKLDMLSEYGRTNFLLERELKSVLKQRAFIKVKYNMYVGVRVKQGLPAYGQRTKSNSSTSKKRTGRS